MIKAYFNDIEKQIVSFVDSANKRIYVAVAWFTNQTLFDCLIRALNRNVDVKVLVLNDILNRSEFGLDFGVLESRGAKVCFSESTRCLMHNKFCIIDDMIITGSYNWTYHANENNENIIITDDVKLVADYCEQFDKLFNFGKRIRLPYEHLKWTDIKEGDFSELRRNIYRDVDAKKDEDAEYKKTKLIKLNEAYKSGKQQELIIASMRKSMMIDILTSQQKYFELKIWEKNRLGKPFNDVVGYNNIGNWYYVPMQIKGEYISGFFVTDYSNVWERSGAPEIKIYNKDLIELLKPFASESGALKENDLKNIRDKILRIDNAKMYFYKFPYPMFENQTREEYTAINLFGIVKTIDGDNVTYYDGWDPEERGRKIMEKFFSRN